MTTARNTSHTRRSRRGPIVLVLLVAAICAGAITQACSATASGTTGSYGWPVKPFDHQHPIRGYFGDPRTVFTGKPTFRSLMSGPGAFSFHFGVDIVAPDGTAVYAVRSGTAWVSGHQLVGVLSDDGFSAQYWHIVPAVRDGQSIVAYKTVLGHIAKGSHHVHLTELRDRVPVNPLAPGHLTPYADHTTPAVSSISFRNAPAGREIAPEFLRGRIYMVVDAQDMPALPVPSPARWRGLPVAPALLTWRMERADTGKVVVDERTAFDVRSTLPDTSDFWSVYARGSHQNMLQFKTWRFWRQPGVYLYQLTRGAFDTRTLRDGVYRVIVTASDTRGNHSSTSRVFTVHN
jgi:hypothetical protein